MSLVTGSVVAEVRDTLDIEAHWVASALALITGAIMTAMGLVRLGWLVDFIPLPAICSFMTGGAITVLSSQLPKIMGITGINTRNPPYRVIIDTLKGLPRTQIDAALGLTALFMLYAYRSACNYAAKKYPQRAKIIFLISTLRTAFVILLYVAISAAVNVDRKHNPLFDIVQSVPAGFQHAAVPKLNKTIIKTFVSKIPVSVIVMLIEHISISKSFGRINNYTIDPNQELVAIGVTNVLGPFLGAYPATGSFSRTTIKSKCGVRTPLAGVITAIVVLLAVYALTEVFYYIPTSALGAVIFHAIGDVITPPSVVWQIWRISPLEVLIYFAGVLVAVFSSIENGVYTTVCVSFFLVIWRLFLSRGHVLGFARIRTVKPASSDGMASSDTSSGDMTKGEKETEISYRTGFLPIDHKDGSNPKVEVDQPYPGVFIYRPTEGFNYPNANRYLSDLTEHIFQHTRRTDPLRVGKLGVSSKSDLAIWPAQLTRNQDRPWNDGLPRKAELARGDDRPTLKAVILDFSCVHHMDVTGAQALIDMRNQMTRYAAPEIVEWRFSNIQSRWTKRALASAGFGFRSPDAGAKGVSSSIFSIADHLGGSSSTTRIEEQSGKAHDIEEGGGEKHDNEIRKTTSNARLLAVHGLNRPFFHFDLQEAVEATIDSVGSREEKE